MIGSSGRFSFVRSFVRSLVMCEIDQQRCVFLAVFPCLGKRDDRRLTEDETR
ncbi:unnamed protein product [Soboliphyme baturini]|uniref:Uncharacterized protein n=1 Tax=Soboliphyme baturini TaxID=241478 RepID=A0A183J9F9_9BILA|nr:unnamed protein product [Soboliphyme baturini]